MEGCEDPIGNDEGGAPSLGCHDFLCPLGLLLSSVMELRRRDLVGVARREDPDIGRGMDVVEDRCDGVTAHGEPSMGVDDFAMFTV